MVCWDKVKARASMRRHGVEDARHHAGVMTPLLHKSVAPSKPKVSRARLRAEADAAYATWKAKQAQDAGSA